MNKSELINNLIRSTFHRAVRESIIAVILIGFFAYQMQTISTGTPKYYGTILIIASLGFIMGVLWSYVIGYRTLRFHPENDNVFWMEAFQTQARLLRTVPLWYIAPVMTGVIISVLPTEQSSFLPFMMMLVFTGLLFAGLTWLNRNQAQKLDEQALSFS